jgi:hypothetical protein
MVTAHRATPTSTSLSPLPLIRISSVLVSRPLRPFNETRKAVLCVIKRLRLSISNSNECSARTGIAQSVLVTGLQAGLPHNHSWIAGKGNESSPHASRQYIQHVTHTGMSRTWRHLPAVSCGYSCRNQCSYFLPCRNAPPDESSEIMQETLWVT